MACISEDTKYGHIELMASLVQALIDDGGGPELLLHVDAIICPFPIFRSNAGHANDKSLCWRSCPYLIKYTAQLHLMAEPLGSVAGG